MRCVIEFIANYWDAKSPLLVGYSGGSDSKALLYALLKTPCRSLLHIAHVDHGWRPESESEALVLSQEAQALGLPFYSVRIDPMGESVSREARLCFFKSLFEKHPFQALLLGHQAGDVAETVLKRILEGAHLTHLSGIDPVSSLYGMTLWRPLLSISKKILEKFLDQQRLVSLIDSTNFDPAYLRARLRLETLPWLTKSFGKEVFDNLLFHARRSRELKEYLDKKVEGRSLCAEGDTKIGSVEGLERVEARHLLRKWAKEEALFLSREAMEKILDFALKKETRRRFSDRVEVKNGCIVFLQILLKQENKP